jgi:hypothetical protein
VVSRPGSPQNVRLIQSQIPGFAIYKLWGLVISPILLGRRGTSAPESMEGVEMQNLSKRQEKLKKRQEKGDPRVQTKTTRR